MLVAYWLIATRTGSTLLVAGLGQGFSALESREGARGADAVVVLGGGASTFQGGGQVVGILTMPSILRALEGARVAKLIGARLVVASGGEPRPDSFRSPKAKCCVPCWWRQECRPIASLRNPRQRPLASRPG